MTCHLYFHYHAVSIQEPRIFPDMNCYLAGKIDIKKWTHACICIGHTFSMDSVPVWTLKNAFKVFKFQEINEIIF